jgi:opacity protein-like surface antigen
MKRILVAAVVATFALGSAAMAQDASCEAKAMGKDGKALSGAAKTSFMKKCMTETCETKAVGSDGKKLAGAAKNSFMKKCQSGA